MGLGGIFLGGVGCILLFVCFFNTALLIQGYGESELMPTTNFHLS